MTRPDVLALRRQAAQHRTAADAKRQERKVLFREQARLLAVMTELEQAEWEMRQAAMECEQTARDAEQGDWFERRSA